VVLLVLRTVGLPPVLGAEGSAGSSALDVQAELAAGSSASAGTGSAACWI
jgi:hypothetical protein